MWLSLAADLGDAKAAEAKNRLDGLMSEQQLEKAKQLAAQSKARRHYKGCE